MTAAVYGATLFLDKNIRQVIFVDRCQIYISYRRDGGDMMAGRLADRLTMLGYSVFYDVETIGSKSYHTQIYEAIRQCNDVLVVLSPNALDRCVHEDDRLRREIAFALENNQNIIPIFMHGFEFPKTLPVDIDSLKHLNGFCASYDYFDAVIEKLQSYLRSPKPEGAATLVSAQKPKNVVYTGLHPYGGDQSYIFISYSHKNSKIVLEIIERLQKDGYRVWYDEGIDPGTEWDDYIADKIEKSGLMVAFLSEEYLGSDNCRDELNYARDLNINRLLVYLTEVKLTGGMAMRLNRLQAIHRYTYPSLDSFIDKLESASVLKSFQE